MNKPKIVVTRHWPAKVEEKLSDIFDTTLNVNDRPMSADELQSALQSADAVLPTVSDKLTADVLGVRPLRAKILGSYGVGFNHIDLNAAKCAGLTVTNTPEVLTDCTADLAMTLLLTLARKVGEGERHLRSGNWSGWRPTHMMGTRVTRKILGLVGMGRIARAVAQRAFFGFGMEILFYDPVPPPSEALGDIPAQFCSSLEQVMSRSDFVSVHCPGSKETYHLIDRSAIDTMQPHAFLINTARGDVIDENALVEALVNRKIAGAALDVHEREPNVSDALLTMENVVLLPHLGSATLETREDMGMRVIHNLEAFFSGSEPPDIII
jgi:lactate dehydrogenase-like 2-hydroxyacid dehydrogenase